MAFVHVRTTNRESRFVPALANKMEQNNVKRCFPLYKFTSSYFYLYVILNGNIVF